MIIPSTPQIMILVALTAGLGFTHYKAFSAGKDSLLAEQAKLAVAERDIYAEAMRGAADAIAKNRPVHKTIQQEAIREHFTNTVYNDCRLPADGVRRINAAVAAGSGERPTGTREVRSSAAAEPGLER